MTGNAFSFLHRDVRNLAWAIASPCLINKEDDATDWPQADFWSQTLQRLQPLFDALQDDPQPLETALQAAGYRLGNYFELLLRFWLEHDPRYRLLHHDLPMRFGGQTLGAFDFIVEDLHSGEIQHWEVAAKFYLGVGDTHQMNAWYGPMQRDRLDLKYRHMREHQCRLSLYPQAQQWLEERELRIDRRLGLMRGRLFYPADSDAVPQGSNPQQLRGWWMTASQWLNAPQAGQLMLLSKRDWLADYQAPAEAQVLDKETIARLDKPLCAALIDEGVEASRGFLVPDDWPQKLSEAPISRPADTVGAENPA